MDTHDRWELKGRLDVTMDAVCHFLQLKKKKVCARSSTARFEKRGSEKIQSVVDVFYFRILKKCYSYILFLLYY